MQQDSMSYQDRWTHLEKYASSPSVVQQKVLSEGTFLNHIVHCVPICEEFRWNLSCIISWMNWQLENNTVEILKLVITSAINKL